jgi:ActR/RegA family two-component response regulator
VDILIVDSDSGTCDFFAIALSANGHRAWTAFSGAEALSAFHARSFDAIFVDFKLTDMSGLAVLRECRKIHPDAKIFVLARDGTVANAVEAMKLGATDYFEKPSSVEHLIRLARLPTDQGDRASRSERSLFPEKPAARRWAELILVALSAPTTPNNLLDWCELVHASRSTLENRCRRAGVSAKASIDMIRVLRAFIDSAQMGCLPDALIDADPRTVRRLFSSVRGSSQPATLQDLVIQQQFVTNTDALAALKRAVATLRWQRQHA